MLGNSQSQMNPQNLTLPSTNPQTPSGQPMTSSPNPPPPPKISNIIIQPATKEEQDQKPAGIILILSIIFSIFGLMSALSTFVFIFIIITLNRGLSSATGFNYELFKYFPTFGIFVMFLTATTFCIFYTALKLKNASKKGFWLGVISSILLMIGPFVLIVLMLDPISNLMRGNEVLLESSQSAVTKTLPQSSILSNIFKAMIMDFFYIVSFVLLIISYSKFRLPDKALSKVSKTFFILLFLFFFLPISVFTVSAYWQASHPNSKYDEMQSKVNFHIYEPKKIPEGLSYATTYRFSEHDLVGKKNVVFLAISAPLTDVGKKKPMITINQVGIDPNFDILAFLATNNQPIKEPITLSKALNQKAFHLYNSSSNFPFQSLVFQTPDHVFISIAAVRTTKEDLFLIAESLE